MKVKVGDRVYDHVKGVRTRRAGTVRKITETGIFLVLFDDDRNSPTDREGLCKETFLNVGVDGERLSLRRREELRVE